MAANKFEAVEREHREFWNSFVRFSTWTTAIVIALLALMAIFLI
ncbi:hypothetical protein STHU_19130 [Allostella humosa]|nr:aa3-type cytochrome c oxidase subunit IV [Stella humosa]BBK31279.1 hypothetical protein STHU_19130 [Stella humosa]